MFFSLRNILEDLGEKADGVKEETNRAAIATANAEIRRGKNYLRGELPKLRKVMAKKNKGLTEEEKEARVEQVDDFEYKIECVPDGVTRSVPAPPQRRGGGGGGGNGGHVHVTVDVDNITSNPSYNMEHTESSRGFRDEFEAAKQRQDEGLDEIAKG
jgi:SYP7 family syntaxin